MIKQIKTAFFTLPGTTQMVVALGALALVAGVLYFSVSFVSERISHWKTQAVVTDANKRIEAITNEVTAARQDVVAAQAVQAELARQNAELNAQIEDAEARLLAAKTTTQKAKKKYETTTQTTTVNDNRPSSVKREELRARYAERGIIVTEK